MGISKPIRLATITVAVEKYSLKTVENAGRKKKVKNIIGAYDTATEIVVCAFDEKCLYNNGSFKIEYLERVYRNLHLNTQSQKNNARIKNITLAEHILGWSSPYHPGPDSETKAEVCWHRMLPDNYEPEESIAINVTNEGIKRKSIKLNWISDVGFREQIEQRFIFEGFNYIMLINQRAKHIGFVKEQEMIKYLVDNNVDNHEIIRINFEQNKLF